METHVTNMLNKLGLNSRVQIIRWVTDPNEPVSTTARQLP